jgi:hypothetical protein
MSFRRQRCGTRKDDVVAAELDRALEGFEGSIHPDTGQRWTRPTVSRRVARISNQADFRVCRVCRYAGDASWMRRMASGGYTLSPQLGQERYARAGTT